MFTGIIEEVGVVRHRNNSEFVISATRVLSNLKQGDSIAIDGACMTVTDLTHSEFSIQVSPESFQRTTFGHLQAGDEVNLERAMLLGDRFNGHLVQGHVDGVGRINKVENQDTFSLWTFDAPETVTPYLLSKGSVTINGISLTVVTPANSTFSVAVIPETFNATTLRSKKPGDRVNMEADAFGKYVFRYLSQFADSDSFNKHPFTQADISVREDET